LFHSRVGWCEQVASSLVVMARSAVRSAGSRVTMPAASLALLVMSVAIAGPWRPRCTEATSGVVEVVSHASVPTSGSNENVTCAPARLTTKVSVDGARPFTSAGVAAGARRGCVACSYENAI
jgi:hypothetical protein